MGASLERDNNDFDEAEHDSANVRSQHITSKLFAAAREVANSVRSKKTDRCTDNREHLLIVACRFVSYACLSGVVHSLNG